MVNLKKVFILSFSILLPVIIYFFLRFFGDNSSSSLITFLFFSDLRLGFMIIIKVILFVHAQNQKENNKAINA